MTTPDPPIVVVRQAVESIERAVADLEATRALLDDLAERLAGEEVPSGLG